MQEQAQNTKVKDGQGQAKVEAGLNIVPPALSVAPETGQNEAQVRDEGIVILSERVLFLFLCHILLLNSS